MILRWGAGVLSPCLILFCNSTNLPADLCRSRYPAIFDISSIALCFSCVGLLVSLESLFPAYDTTLYPPIHSHPHITLIHHFSHTSFRSSSCSRRNHMTMFTTEQEINPRKISLGYAGIDTSQPHSSRRDIIYESVTAIE
jgi:hypothetical protein